MSLIYLQIVSMAFLIIFVGISKVRILAIVIAIIIMINKTSIKSTKPDKPKKLDIGCDRGSNRKGMAINDRTPASILDLLRKYPEDFQSPNEIRKPHPKKR